MKYKILLAALALVFQVAFVSGMENRPGDVMRQRIEKTDEGNQVEVDEMDIEISVLKYFFSKFESFAEVFRDINPRNCLFPEFLGALFDKLIEMSNNRNQVSDTIPEMMRDYIPGDDPVAMSKGL